MKFIAYFIIFISFWCSLNANKTIDSLQKEIANAKNNSLKKIHFQNLVDFAIHQKQSEATKYIDMYSNFGKESKNDTTILHAEQFRAILKAQKGKINESNELLIEILPKLKKLNNPEILARNYNLMGTNYYRLGEHAKAAELFELSIEICTNHKLVNVLGSNYIMLGILNNSIAQFKSSEHYYLKAIELFSNTDDKEMLATIYKNLANLYTQLKNYKPALEYYKKSEIIDIEVQDSSGLAITYHNIGVNLYSQKQYKKSLEYIKKSKGIKIRLGNEISVAHSDLALGEISMLSKDYSASLKYLKSAEKVFLESGLSDLLLNTYDLLDSVYTLTHNYKMSREYLKKFSTLKDSIYTKDQSQIVSELNAKYDLADKELAITKKEKENELLKLKNDRQTLYIILAIIIIVLIAVFITILYLKNITVHRINNDLIENKKKIEEQNTQLEKMNIELEVMNKELIHTNNELTELNITKDKFFSIISHDLKGPVYAQSNIVSILSDDYDSISDKDKKEFLDLLNDSSTQTTYLLENLLTWGRSQMNKIDVNFDTFDLRENIEQTVSFLKSNANLKDITINNNCPKNTVIHADPNLISTVIRNITNNSIKFTSNGGLIKIDYSKPNSEHLITISDSGVGMSEETARNLFRLDKANSTPGTNDEKGTGLGLIIVKEFIDKHKGNIWVKSEIGKGTRTNFTIPEIR